MTPGAQELEAISLAKATTNTHLAELKAALRGRFDADTANLLSRCLDNAYGHGFCDGSLHIIDTQRATA